MRCWHCFFTKTVLEVLWLSPDLLCKVSIFSSYDIKRVNQKVGGVMQDITHTYSMHSHQCLSNVSLLSMHFRSPHFVSSTI